MPLYTCIILHIVVAYSRQHGRYCEWKRHCGFNAELASERLGLAGMFKESNSLLLYTSVSKPIQFSDDDPSSTNNIPFRLNAIITRLLDSNIIWNESWQADDAAVPFSESRKAFRPPRLPHNRTTLWNVNYLCHKCSDFQSTAARSNVTRTLSLHSQLHVLKEWFVIPKAKAATERMTVIKGWHITQISFPYVIIRVDG